MSKLPYKTWVEISRSALADNTRTLKKTIGKKTQLMAVVKSNAYGHGAREVVPIFKSAGADWFGVDSIDEALSIFEYAEGAPILILGYTLLDRLEDAVAQGFRLTVYNPETIRALSRICKRRRAQAYLHLKCDTGTTRQGVLLEEVVPIAKMIAGDKNLILEGLSMHFANIEDTADHSFAKAQLLKFKRMYGALQNAGIKISMKHTACSAAAVLFPETYFNLVRAGIALYGLWPSKETKISAAATGRKIHLRPALTWKTRLAQIKNVPSGTAVSYGLTERVSRNSKIAVLPVGYWDGFDRGLSSVGVVLVHGRRAKIMGRVCMNMSMADVTDIGGARPEDEAVLLGAQGREIITAEEIAQKLGTINYEVVTRINPLIPRILV